MLPQDFHPIVQAWWASRFGAPTEAQLEGWQAIRRGVDTLIAAPTGSGKTLAAFLTALDRLFREGLERALPDEVRIIYVSPLKALSADIHKNLAEPRREIHALSPQIKITAAVRSGDTPQNERAAMLRTPPHILVTTPESLYLLLTAERSREMLKTARVVIVDEIHAVLQSRRGAHLALSLERLDHVCGRRLQRIGLSATQKPIEEVARFLREAAMVCRDVFAAEAVRKLVRHPLGKPPRVHHDERRAVRFDELDEPLVDLTPDLVRHYRFERRARYLDRKIDFALVTLVDDCAGRARKEARDLFDRLLRRRKADAL